MPTNTQKDYSKLYMPAAIVLAGVIIGAFIMTGLSKGGAVATGGTQPTVNVDIKDVITKGEPYIGDANAPVTLAYWSDYQCPFCKAVELGGVHGISIVAAIPTLVKEYVETGKLRIIFKDFAFLSEDSVTAALYDHAIWDLYPKKYWEWREAMYESQDEEHGGFGDAVSIDALNAKISGIDVAKVKAQIVKNTDAYTAAIEADKAEGAKFGIQGTPGFITGKTLIPGAVELATFKEAIDPQLK